MSTNTDIWYIKLIISMRGVYKIKFYWYIQYDLETLEGQSSNFQLFSRTCWLSFHQYWNIIIWHVRQLSYNVSNRSTEFFSYLRYSIIWLLFEITEFKGQSLGFDKRRVLWKGFRGIIQNVAFSSKYFKSSCFLINMRLLNPGLFSEPQGHWKL